MVDAFYKMYNSKIYCEVTNVGNGKGYSVQNLFDIISNKNGIEKKIIIDKKRLRPKNSEVNKLICDNTKMRKVSSWKPKFSIDKGLHETLKWISENQEKFKSDKYNV